MMANVGFDKAKALVLAGALAEQLNETHGDNIDPAVCVAVVKKFIESDVDIKCRYCGWRKPESRFCTAKQSDTCDGESCEVFKHVFEAVE